MASEFRFSFLTILAVGLLISSSSGQQDPRQRGREKAHQRNQQTPVLVPADQHQEQQQSAPPTPHLDDPHDHGHTAVGPDDDPNQPRPPAARSIRPFLRDRPLLEVNGSHITAAELNELVAYDQSWRQGVIDLHLRRAVKALLPRTVLADLYRADLPAMRQRADQALARIRAGEEWEKVAMEVSDDTEAENPEGRYTFGRERAVQPFDLHAHSGKVGEIQGPFLTVYGFHFLQILAYHRGAVPAEDRSEVRHILIMYPDLKKRSEAGEDIRAYIKEQVARARIRALEPAVRNLVPPPTVASKR